ncbi:hypothetical protein [Streptomyces sp. NPDC008001]|uniref:hypothetical protein n=1 Tax=Streptomyces sp. NPDC008001 TaxID=3364804 RepID=UPI0036DFD096
MLLQAGVSRVGYIRAQLDPVRSGLVVSGPGAAVKARKLREEGFTGPLLADPAVYTVAAASEDDPFPDVSEGQLAFGDPLRLSVEEQVGRAGATAAMTPTGYLHAEASDALKAAVHRVLALEDPHVFFSVPVDVAWLRDDAVEQLIAWLNVVPNPKAVMLGGQMDPLAGFSQAVGNLKRLLAEVPGTALLRADLAAFGALAQGAAFTAFGATSSVRHIVPPGQAVPGRAELALRAAAGADGLLPRRDTGEEVRRRPGAGVPVRGLRRTRAGHLRQQSLAGAGGRPQRGGADGVAAQHRRRRAGRAARVVAAALPARGGPLPGAQR